MAAAAVSLACPLRRSTRLAHAHRNIKQHIEQDNDSSSSDPENELTPRALRALKRQRLALDPDGLPFSPRSRSRKRRKENTNPAQVCFFTAFPSQLTRVPALDAQAHPETRRASPFPPRIGFH